MTETNSSSVLQTNTVLIQILIAKVTAIKNLVYKIPKKF